MHKVPIPRLGGLAIFIAFMFSVLIFGQIDTQTKGILLGATIIVVLGVLDDIMALQGAAEVRRADRSRRSSPCCTAAGSSFSPTRCGSAATYLAPRWLSIPVTIIWIVAITNAVNFIDGLDGLAVGVSAHLAASMLVVALMVRRLTSPSSCCGARSARAWALSRIISTRQRFSWATPARHSWALSWRRVSIYGPVQDVCHHLVCRAVPDPGRADLRYLLCGHPPRLPRARTR